MAALAGASAATNSDLADCILQVVDPVGGGFVTVPSRPGANITGFANYDYEIGGKWLEILKGGCAAH